MKFEPCCEVDACTKDALIIFKIEDVFDVELCTEHSRTLRAAIFLDEGIVAAIKAHAVANVAVEIVIHHANEAADIEAGMTETADALTKARAHLYKAVMAWLKKEKAE